MNNKQFHILFSLLLLSLCFFVGDVNAADDDACNVTAFVIGRDRRKEVAVTEYGEISAVDIHDEIRGSHYHLQFITLEPNSLFLPVLLHADMIFYVHTGSGSLNWVGEEKMNEIKVGRGDVYRLHSGSVFYLQSSLESTREKLRIHAIFTNSTDDHNQQEMFSGVYSSVADMVLGFDARVLRSAFQVPREVAEEIKQSSRPPPIVHAPSKNITDELNWGGRIIKALIQDGSSSFELINGKKRKDKKKKKNRAFNILDKTPDVKNCNGWSTSVNSRKFGRLSGSNMGIFAVNLTQGSMMGPHWNPRASEIAVVTHGRGMIHVVCPNSVNESESKTMRFMVNEGDVFYIARFHPMAQMAYNNGTFVFMGFSTVERENYPQFLAGKASVLRALDRDILAMAFNVSDEAIDRLASSQVDSTILRCLSCAEEEERRMWDEIERKRQEEEARRKEEEEEAKRREEEEERRRREEEEEARRRHEEEEEARKRKEEEEEAGRKREEEEAKKREEEEARRRQEEEEEARRRQEEEEARRKQGEEEARRREEEEEEARQRRKEEEARQKEQEEEEARRQREQEEEEGGGGGGAVSV